MTNYEEIKAMGRHELAEFLSSIMDGQKCPASEKFCDGQRCCVDAILNWLTDEPVDSAKGRESMKPHTGARNLADDSFKSTCTSNLS